MRRFALPVIAATAAVLVLATSASARRTDLAACDLFTIAQIASILGQKHAMFYKEAPGDSGPDNTSGVTHSYCNGLAWGSTQITQTPAGLKQALRNGTGAAFKIDTWAPDEASLYPGKWASDFGTMIDLLTSAGLRALVAPDLPAFGGSNPRVLTAAAPNVGGDGAIGVIVTPMPQVRAIGGAWWSSQAEALVVIGFETSVKKATANRLNQLAQIGVTAFGLNPLPLH